MSQFETWPYKHQTLKNGRGEILIDDYLCNLMLGRVRFQAMIKCPFIWDGASIPKWCRLIVGTPLQGRYQRAALVHDWLYVMRYCVLDGGNQVVTRRKVDQIFRQVMNHDGVSFWRRWVMWIGVRLGGWVPWRKRTKAGQVGNSFWTG